MWEGIIIGGVLLIGLLIIVMAKKEAKQLGVSKWDQYYKTRKETSQEFYI